MGFLQTRRALISPSIVEILAVGHAVAGSTAVAGSVMLPLISEEIEPVVKGVHAIWVFAYMFFVVGGRLIVSVYRIDGG